MAREIGKLLGAMAGFMLGYLISGSIATLSNLALPVILAFVGYWLYD